jgi:hypothetical protein
MQSNGMAFSLGRMTLVVNKMRTNSFRMPKEKKNTATQTSDEGKYGV